MLKKINWLIILLLIAVCAYLGAEAFSFYLKRIWDVAPKAFLTISDKQGNEKSRGRDAEFYKIISSRDLFSLNPPEKESTKEGEVQKNVPLTELKLKLLGTMVGRGVAPYAIIKDLKTRSQDIYRVGDSIGPAEVTNIYRNRVILKHNGAEEMLIAFESLEEITGEREQADQQEQVAETHSAPSISPRKTPRDEYARIGEKIAQNHWVVKRSDVQDIVNNASQLLTQIRIIPHFQGGDLNNPDGFQVANIVPRTFFDKMGLKSGDIIKSVNGESVNSPESAFEAYQRLKNESRIQVNLIRAGKEVNLKYDIND